MARPIVLSNGELHVGLNNWGMVHDFYFPYVGLENHSAGAHMTHHVGVWIDGEFSWLDDGTWDISMSYPHDALVGHTIAKNRKMGLVLEFDDFVDSEVSAFMRNIHVINQSPAARDIRLFMSQAFAIGDSRSNTDTAQYLPGSDAVLHYRGRRAFVISGAVNDEPFDQHSIGLFGIEGREGTWRDAEDGELGGNNVEHGRVDSVLRFPMRLAAQSSTRVHYWIAAGTSMRAALYVHGHIKDEGLISRQRNTADWWRRWLEPAMAVVDRIDKAHRKSFLTSLMIIKSQMDNRGATMASTDSAMLKYWRDAYAYSWPRDGALVMWPLIRLGYQDEPRRYFEFCQRGLHPDGYLMHKYRADGALGSSWHPYVHEEGIIGAPFQEDETALTVFMFAQYYQKNPSQSLLDSFYESFIKPMANFMMRYVDEATGLPRPSYNLWEEHYMTSTFATGATYGALVSASELAAEAGDDDSAVAWRSAAGDIRAAAQKYLFNKERGAFYKGLLVKDGEILQTNDTVDLSSLFGAYMFGLFGIDSREVQQMVETVKQVFDFSFENPGLPRYEDDNYQRPSMEVLGNFWHITTLWMAQYELEAGGEKLARRILDWTQEHALESGVLSEQINALNGCPDSVAPLTWSHAEYVGTLLDTITEPADS